MSDARLTEALARLEEHHKLHLPLRRNDILGRLMLRFLWRRQVKWQIETNLATRDALGAMQDVSRTEHARIDERLHNELDSLRRNDQNMMAGLNQRLYSAIGRVQTQLGDLRMQLGDRMENSAEIEQRVKAMEEQVAALLGAARDVRTRHVQLDLFLDEMRSAAPDKPKKAITETVGNREHFIELALSELLDGPAEQVREARRSYLATVPGQGDSAANGPVFDMAPARGEWLEVLRAAGLPYRAASLNPLVRRQCAEAGSEVAEGDPLDVLAGAAKRSLAAVTAFRYVERLDPAILARFVDLAAAALQPGGVLVIETPVVGAEDFHVDPFAKRPVHPTYLGFLADAAGFARTEVRPVRTQPLNRKVAPLGSGQADADDRYCLIAWR
ncbi:MAG: hypothetical protein ABW224_23100 [Kibdelosporangium sp.]